MTALDHRDDARQEEAAAPGEVRRWRAFALLAVAYFMTIVDLTITNVALPTIGRLRARNSRARWNPRSGNSRSAEKRSRTAGCPGSAVRRRGKLRITRHAHMPR
jgi:hypothetical protein